MSETRSMPRTALLTFEDNAMFKKITIVVNLGMADDIMDITCAAGARGGTILHGRVIVALEEAHDFESPGNGILFVEDVSDVRGVVVE